MPPRPWDDFTAYGAISVRPEGGATPANAADRSIPSNDFPALKQALRGAAGEEVAVILVRDGRSETFNFIAPVEPLMESPSRKAVRAVATAEEPAASDQLLGEE